MAVLQQDDVAHVLVERIDVHSILLLGNAPHEYDHARVPIEVLYLLILGWSFLVTLYFLHGTLITLGLHHLIGRPEVCCQCAGVAVKVRRLVRAT